MAAPGSSIVSSIVRIRWSRGNSNMRAESRELFPAPLAPHIRMVARLFTRKDRIAAARDDAGGRFGRFGQRHRFVRHLEHDLGLAGILPCDAREGPPQHRRLRRMLCPRGHPARNHSSNAAARLALELVAKTTKGNTGGSGQSERLSRSARFIGQSGRFCRSYRLRRRSISKRDLQRNRSRTATVAAPAGR